MCGTDSTPTLVGTEWEDVTETEGAASSQEACILRVDLSGPQAIWPLRWWLLFGDHKQIIIKCLLFTKCHRRAGREEGPACGGSPFRPGCTGGPGRSCHSRELAERMGVEGEGPGEPRWDQCGW